MSFVHFAIAAFACNTVFTESRTLPVGVQPLTQEQINRLSSWTEDSDQNIWELSGQFEGDIVQNVNQRNGMISTAGRWPNGVVPYEIDSTQYTPTTLKSIADALAVVASVSCIKLRPATLADNDYIFVTAKYGGCWSYIGRTGGRQVLGIGPGCTSSGTVIHEFLHALGFYHQHNDPNRDSYVTIHWENIQTGMNSSFYKNSASSTTSFGEPYDYDSIMHYSRTAFTKNYLDTIVPTDPEAEIGKRVLSPSDIVKLNKMYNCST